MGEEIEFMTIHLELLSSEHAEELFAFERDNRTFFETMVPGRGDDYFIFENFIKGLADLLTEQSEGISFFHVIKDENDNLVGRMNIVDIDRNSRNAHIGYRVGEAYLGTGIASKALRLAIEKAVHEYNLTELQAKTTSNNVASQQVLLKNGFKLTQTDDDFLYYIWKKQ